MGNPEAVGEAEKALWAQIETLLNDLLDELKSNGKIETVYTFAESAKLHDVIMTLDNIGKSHNALLHFLKRPDFQTLIQQTTKFELDETRVIYMYIADDDDCGPTTNLWWGRWDLNPRIMGLLGSSRLLLLASQAALRYRLRVCTVSV